MASTYLTLSRSSVTLSSAWSGYESGYNEVRYTQPTYAEGAVNVTLPSQLSGAAIYSAHLSYSVSGGSGTRRVRYDGSATSVTDANLLSRLQDGAQSLKLAFSFRATGGSGGEGSHSVAATWSNIKILVEYLPKSAVSGVIAALDGGIVRYGFDRGSLAVGESGMLSLSVKPNSACTVGVQLLSSGSVICERAFDALCPANAETALEMPLSVAAQLLTSRVNAASLRITLGETVLTASTDFKLISQRLSPQVSAVWTDETALLTTFGGFVQGKSSPLCTIAVTLDTASDSGIHILSRVLELGTQRLESGGEPFAPTELLPSGSVPYTVTVTDSCGGVGLCSGTLNVLPYAAPCLTALSVERWADSTDENGNPIQVQDDYSDKVRLSLSGAVSSLNGLNTWTLSCAYTDGETSGSAVIASGAGGTFSYTDDSSLFTTRLSETKAWNLTFTLADSVDSAVYDLVLPKAGGIFSIEKGGVAVGKRCTATEDSPEFQVAYPAVFEGGVRFASQWQPITVESGITVVEPCAIRRVADTVYVRGAVRKTAAVANSAYFTVANLPTGYIPAYRHHRPVTADTAGYSIYAETDGQLRLRNRTGASRTNEWVSLDCSYTVE